MPSRLSRIHKASILILLSWLSIVVDSCVPLQRFQTGRVAIPTVWNQPGQVAWSPDSRQLAVVSETDLIILKPSGMRVSTFPGIRPLYIEWEGEDEILLLHTTSDGSTMASGLSVSSGALNPVTRIDNAKALFRIGNPGTVVALDGRVRDTQVGVFSDVRLLRVLPGGPEELLTIHANLPAGISIGPYTAAWAYKPVRPYYDTLLVPQYRKPPMFPPRIELSTFDPFTREREEVGTLDLRRFFTPTSWSPDGNWLAFPDDGGYLNILHAVGGATPMRLSGSVTGDYPAWHPTQRMIFFGGHLLDLEGNVLKHIAGSGVETIGIWSPDGQYLVLLDSRGLRIVDDVDVPEGGESWTFPQERDHARDQLRTLKRLLEEGLIESGDYDARRLRHLEVLSE